MGENENAQQAEGGGQAAPAEGGSGDKGGDKKITNVLSNVFLTLAAGWGITEIALNEGVVERPFATAAFGLFAIRGLTSAINYFLGKEPVKKADDQVKKFTDNFGLPLLSVAILESKCMNNLWKLVFLLAPAVDYTGFHTKINMHNLYTIAHAFAAGGVFVCGLQRDDVMGIVYPLAYISYVITRDNLENQEDIYIALIALGVVTAWYTLRHV